MANIIHITKEGERWDTIAYKVYGDATLFVDIIKANPTIPVYPSLPGNLKINVPVKDKEIVDNNNLPPWKR